MKTDLATSVAAAVIGVITAYFICNLFLPALDDVTLKTINADATYTLTQPDPEVFNFRAVNPTVEVYVGQCAEYNEYGECVESTDYVENYDAVVEEEKAELEDETASEETQDGTSD